MGGRREGGRRGGGEGGRGWRGSGEGCEIVRRVGSVFGCGVRRIFHCCEQYMYIFSLYLLALAAEGLDASFVVGFVGGDPWQ